MRNNPRFVAVIRQHFEGYFFCWLCPEPGSWDLCSVFLRIFSDQLRQLHDQPLGVVPADAGVGDGFSVDAIADVLAAGLQVALHHESLDHGFQMGGLAAG